MAIHTPKTQAQREFLTNVERAKKVGIETETANMVYQAVLGGLSYCNFSSDVASLTDNYLNFCIEYLYDKAVEVHRQDLIKWVGIE